MPSYTFYNTGSDPQYMGVTAVLQGDEPKTLGELMSRHGKGELDDVFDVTLYGNPEGTDEERVWYQTSFNALEAMTTFATLGVKYAEAIKRLEAVSDSYETERRRAILFVAYDREVAPGERWEGGKPYVTEDPHTLDDARVNELWAEVGDTVVTEVFETGDYLTGEDYEALDGNDGAQQAIQHALSILQEVASS